MPAEGVLTVVCNGCGATGTTTDGSNPDAAVTCAPESGCCQADHGPGGHMGDVCDRTVTIHASADLIADLGQG